MRGWPALPQILVAIALVALTANVIVYTQLYTGVMEPTGAVSPLCGNNEIDPDYEEECDGIDDELCPDECLSTCLCPPVGSRMRKDTTIYRQRFYFNNLTQNETIKINTTKPSLAFVSISFFMANSTHNLTFNVDSNTSAPERAVLPPGVVYEYWNISYKCNNTKVEDFTIEFRINKSWIIEKSIDFNTINFFYYKDINIWAELGASHTKETRYYHYYNTFSTGPGMFAIAGSEVPEPAPLAAPFIPYCGNGKIDENETSENCCVDVSCPTGFYCNNNKCEQFALCGNNICDHNETITNCPQDCARTTFFSPVYWLILIGIIALSVIGFLLMTEDHKKIIRKKPRTPLMLKFSQAR